MGTPFLAEVKIISFGFAPKGWAFCNGQLLPMAQNQALFSLLSTTYGGDGKTTFALPNLQGRTPMHWGTGNGLPAVAIGQADGEAAHTLTIAEMPGHTHTPSGSSSTGGTTPTPNLSLLGVSGSGKDTYSQTSPNTTMVANMVGYNGDNEPHPNMQPYLTLNFIIALQGVYPSRG